MHAKFIRNNFLNKNSKMTMVCWMSYNEFIKLNV
jgi:hypothetical protein